MTYIELSALRAKRGMAQQKASLLYKYKMVDGAVQHACLYAVALGGPYGRKDTDREERLKEVVRLEAERDAIAEKILSVCYIDQNR